MKYIISTIILIVTAGLLNVLSAQSDRQQARHKAVPATSTASMGAHVHLNGEWAFIAAPDETIEDELLAGSVHVYRDQDGTWTATQVMHGDSTFALNQFGSAIAAHGNWVAITGKGVHDSYNHHGTIQLFQLNSGNWEFHSKLHLEDAEHIDHIGRSVTMNDTYLAFAGRNRVDSPFSGGTVAIFRRTGNNWVFDHEITAEITEGDLELGQSLHLTDQNELFVGVPRSSAADTLAGAVHIYRADENGNWGKTQRLDSPSPQFREFFGDAVAVSGDYAVVGAMGTIIDGRSRGSVYVYRRSGDQWNLVNHLYPEFPQTDMRFGSALSFDGKLLAVSAYRKNIEHYIYAGAVFMYLLDDGSVTDEMMLNHEMPAHHALFGHHIAVSGTNVLVGSHMDGPENRGAAYFYRGSDLFTILDTEEVAYIPSQLRLLQNYPNPFNPATTITFHLPESHSVRLMVYDMLGRQISLMEDGLLEAGVHSRTFDGTSLASGVYVYVLEIDGNQRLSRKFSLIK